MEYLNNLIETLSGIGHKRKALYNKLGINNILSLINFFPISYIDYQNCIKISDITENFEGCVKVLIIKTSSPKYYSKTTIFSLVGTDGADFLYINIFNNKFSAKNLELNKEYYIYGKFSCIGTKVFITSPSFIPTSQKNILTPKYKLTKGITNNIISKNIKSVLEYISENNINIETLPNYIINKYNLISKLDAITNIHLPINSILLEKAKKRLIFEELFILQLGINSIKINKKIKSSISIQISDISPFIKSLPFSPTLDQDKSIKDCITDMLSNNIMNRMIQGDVGSGKTLIAAAISYLMAKNKYQTAIMVPTEILAEQHFKTFLNFFKPFGISIAILTGSIKKKEKQRLKDQISVGCYDIVIGTHAIIQSDIYFKNLGLVITDEQHRFGVSQRAKIISKGFNPHTIIMSATPIPRTLALTLYTDLDISLIKTMPSNRKQTQTFLISSKKKNRMYNFAKEKIDNGQQVYIVCPSIQENQANTINVEDLYDNLSTGYFKDYKIKSIHGKLNSLQKDEIMQDFKQNKIHILIATTVIEVGIDIPNATIIIIENAERFGLSQLHQLRGRVGRGDIQSYCILLSDSTNKESLIRLKTLKENIDGFKISEEDLRLRGPGDFIGNRQHGLPSLNISNLIEDSSTLLETSLIAHKIIKKDPNLIDFNHSSLKNSVKRLFDSIDINIFN